MNSLFNKNKKGNAFVAVIVAIIVIFGAAIVIGSFSLIYSFISPGDLFENNTLAYNITEERSEGFASFWDGAIIFILIGLWAAAIMSSFMIDSHPIFFIITMFALVISMVVGGYMSNIWEDLVTSEPTWRTSFPMVDWVLSNFLIVLFGIGLTTAIALFAKKTL